ncbi:MAG: Hsp20/alpha crystallin family protein [Methanosphaera sp.]|nr:Hsp20/alpha crystallin family protein [Methanosphaera sp.]
MADTNIDIDKKDETIDVEAKETEETCGCEDTEETCTIDDESSQDECECSDEETCDEKSDKTDDSEDTDYKVYGKETSAEAKNMAEKMLSDVYATLKSRQSDWNKTLEEYKSNKPAVDLLEYDDRIELKMDLPRVTKDDISIKMSTESIEIEVEFPDVIGEEECKVLRKERCSGRTKNIVPIPVEIDIKEVSATFSDNELTLTLPKIKGRKVDVEIV